MSALTILAASACAALCVALAVIVASREPRESDRALELWAAVLFASAWALGHVAAIGPPSWRGWEHQPFWVALGAALSAAVSVWSRSGAVGVLLCGSWLVTIVVWAGAAAEWSQGAARWLGFVLVALGTLGLIQLAVSLAPRLGRLDGPGIHGLVAAGLGVVAYSSSYAKFALLAGVLGGVLLPIGIAVACRAGRRLPVSVVLCATTIALSLLLGAWFHISAERRAPSPGFLALAAALPAAWIGQLKVLSTRPRTRAAVRLLAVAALVGLAALAVSLGEGVGTEAPADEDWEW